MTILLQWLIEYAWVLYPLCAIGFVVYVVRALVAQRERNRGQFTLERDAAAIRALRAWAMALLFVVIGAIVFVSATFILPSLDIAPPPATPTLEAGLEFTTPTFTPSPSPTVGFSVPTSNPISTSAQVPTPPPPPTESPTPEQADVPDVAVAGEVNVRFGDFARLVSYGLPASEVTAAQPLVLTLQWQALEAAGAAEYLVFTHLLSEDGRLIAQHDGIPAEGTRPTTGWSSGEIIVDIHPMTFYDTAYTGLATIAVGMYDPGDPGARVRAETGSDYVILPITISIVP